MYTVTNFSDTVITMRDGIYKGLKLGRRWRTLLKRCEREAERDLRARAAALAALDGDLRRDVSSATVRELLAVATSASSLLPGFSPHDLIRQSDDRSVTAQTPLEDVVWRHFDRVISGGARREKAVSDALRDALREWGTRRLRQVEEHYHGEAGAEAYDVLGAAERAIYEIDCQEVAARLIRKEKPARPETSHIDPDEDLIGRQANDDQNAFR